MAKRDAKAIVEQWIEPTKEDVDKWFAGLKEEAIRVEDDMIHPTKNDEAAALKARAKEAKVWSFHGKSQSRRQGKKCVEHTKEGRC